MHIYREVVPAEFSCRDLWCVDEEPGLLVAFNEIVNGGPIGARLAQVSYIFGLFISQQPLQTES